MENPMAESEVELIRMITAMERYSLSRDTFDIAAKAGHIQKHRLARAVYFDAREIDRWIMGKSHAV
jgi:predicted DNA-binding transcriptional regulator AlpA